MSYGFDRYMEIKNGGRQMEKVASQEEIQTVYADGLEKVASTTGVPAEIIDQAIASYQEDLVKEAQLAAQIESLEPEEAEELLKEAAAQSPELKGMIAQQQEVSENEELAKLASYIDGLSEDEAEKILAEIS